ncbi:MAG: hypothetical protein M3N43_04235 [Actinomycetota bacterium]|nr:hypothetical protein [Actinomycetota bacterium]
MRRFATIFARFVGLTIFLYGAVIFFGNLVAAMGNAAYDPFWSLYLVLGVGLTGMAGAVVFLLTFDGPFPWRTRGRRALGWIGMLMCALLPASFVLLIAPLALVGGLTLLIPPESPARQRGRHLATSG